MLTHRGGCHCGGVRFEVDAPAVLEVEDCNCSMCRRSGYLHLLVDAPRLRVTAGAELLASYRFNTGSARHTFCRVCGVKPFYVPRSNPAGYSVNARCLDPGTVSALRVRPFDGRNWEQAAPALAARNASPP
jgi:hypothetical protein